MHNFYRRFFSLVFVLAFCNISKAASYVWNGSVSTVWNFNNNWTPNTGFPGIGDNVTIVAGLNNPCTLDGSREIFLLVVQSGGSLALNSFTLTIDDKLTTTGGTVSNGTLITGDGSSNYSLTNTTFNNITVELFGIAGVSGNSGNNIFNGNTTLINASDGGGTINSANTTGVDTYNGDLQLKNIAVSGSGSGINIANTFSVTVAGNINVEGVSDGDVRLGNGVQKVLLSGALYTSGIFSDGRLLIKNLSQTSVTTSTLSLTGVAGLYVGGGTAVRRVIFQGPVNFSSPEMYFDGAYYYENASFEIVPGGTTTTFSYGNNTWAKSFTLKNSSSTFTPVLASRATSTLIRDSLLLDANYIINSSSSIYHGDHGIFTPGGKTSTVYKGDINITSSGTGCLNIESNAGNSAPPVELTTGVKLNFGSGNPCLNLNYVSQKGINPPVTVFNGTSGSISSTGCAFDAPVNLNIPSTSFSTCTFFSAVNLTVTGAGGCSIGSSYFTQPVSASITGSGGGTLTSNIFNNTATFDNGSSGNLSTNGNTFNGNTLLQNSGTNPSSISISDVMNTTTAFGGSTVTLSNLNNNPLSYIFVSSSTTAGFPTGITSFNVATNINVENKGGGVLFGLNAGASPNYAIKINSGKMQIGPNGFDVGLFSMSSTYLAPSPSAIDMVMGSSSTGEIDPLGSDVSVFWGPVRMYANQIATIGCIQTFGDMVDVRLDFMPGAFQQLFICNAKFYGPFTFTNNAGAGKTLIMPATYTFSNNATFNGTGNIIVDQNHLSTDNFYGDITTNAHTYFYAQNNMKGTIPQNIYGTDSSIFYRLWINNTSGPLGSVSMYHDVKVLGYLALGSGVLDLNGHNINLVDSNNLLNGIQGGSATSYLKSEDLTGHNKGRVKLRNMKSTGSHPSDGYIPFGANIGGTDFFLPFNFNITSGAADTLTVSTYHTNPALATNNRPLPIAPDSVPIFTSNGIENAPYVVDRFWQIDVKGTPTANLIFTYPDPEWTGVGTNTITEANLQAQHWMGTDWSSPMGIVGTAVNTVTVTGVTNFSPWVLVDNTHPLNCPQIQSTQDLTMCSGGIPTTLSAAAGSINNYFWSPSTGLSATNSGIGVNASPSITTTYTVTDSGCGIPATVKVTVNSLPSINSSPDLSVCGGLNASLTATGGADYSWSPATYLNSSTNSSVIFSLAPPGTYNYTVTGSDSGSPTCTNTHVLTITVNSPPSVNAGLDQAICAGSSASLTATGPAGNYTWAPTLYLVSSTGNNVTAIVPVTFANYTFTVSIQDLNGCRGNDSVVVSVVPSLTANAGQDVNITCGSSTELTGSGGLTFVWSPSIGLSVTDANVTTFTLTTPGTYTYSLTVSSGMGCTSPPNEVIITVNNITANAGSDVIICTGSAATLTGSGGSTFIWLPSTGLTSTNNNVTTFNLPTPGIYSYSLIAFSGSGCVSDPDTVVVNVIAYPTVYAGQDIILTYGASATLSAQSNAGSYFWNPSIPCVGSNCLDVTINPLASISYIITASNGNCGVNDTINIYVNILKCDPFVPDAFSPNADGQNDIVGVYGDCISPDGFVFRIYNRWGQLVFQTSNPSKGWNGKLNNNYVADAVFVYYLDGQTVYKDPIHKQGNITLMR